MRSIRTELDAKYGKNLGNLLNPLNGSFNHQLAKSHRLGETYCPFGNAYANSCFDTGASNAWLLGFVYSLQADDSAPSDCFYAVLKTLGKSADLAKEFE